MAPHSIGPSRQELRETAISLLIYCALLGGVGYGVFTASRHPGLIVWLDTERARSSVQPRPTAVRNPQASLAPKLRGALAD